MRALNDALENLKDGCASFYEQKLIAFALETNAKRRNSCREALHDLIGSLLQDAELADSTNGRASIRASDLHVIAFKIRSALSDDPAEPVSDG